MFTRRLLPAVLIVLSVCLALSSAFAGTSAPYVGSWSNGRGETLVVTSRTLQAGEDEPVAFKDMTRVSDGDTFQLHITAKGEVNGFDGKYLSVEMTGRKEMKITQYDSYKDCLDGERAGSVVNWFRD